MTNSYQQGINVTAAADDSEDVNLIEGGGRRSSSHGNNKCWTSLSQSKKRVVYIIVVGACILLAISGHVFRSHRSSTAGGSSTKKRTFDVPYDDTTLEEKRRMIHRPFCEEYVVSPTASSFFGHPSQEEKSSHVNVIESSMGHPSQHWKNVPCFPSSTTSGNVVVNMAASTTVTTTANSEGTDNIIGGGFHTTTKTTYLTMPTLQEQQAQQQRIGIANVYGAPDAVLTVNFSEPAFGNNNKKPILGFGGAFTEAAALNYNRLSTEGKDTVMELLFGKTGLGYRMGRLVINSCDFAIKSYSFDETEDDFNLTDFDTELTHDVHSGMMGMAQRATAVLRESWSNDRTSGDSDDGDLESSDGSLLLFASPWSPPSWMKQPTWQDKKRAIHAAKMTYSTEPTCLRDGVGKHSKYAAAWALYFSKYITAVERILGQGRPLWAVTVQNEPEFAAPWEACAYTKTTEAEFVAHHLGPQLRQDHPATKLLVFDHNKDHVNRWMDTLLLNDTIGARPYVDGTAYHWYAGGMDRLLDGALGIPNMHRLQENLASRYYPNDTSKLQQHVVLGSESCHCPTTAYAGGDISVAWARAERYAHVLLADLAAGSQGWLEWNLILDGIGGPNHLHNLCETTLLSVPHRAKGVSMDNTSDAYIPPLPDFETDKPMGNVSIGDGRTREELNALGFPAKYLDVGVAVQPMYYYMGHVSRHVRPGAMAVMAILTTGNGANATTSRSASRIFRPAGQDVMGGGENDLAANGIELTTWPCEGSTRQQFYWNHPNQEYEQQYGKNILVKGHDWLGHPTTSCIGRQVDKDLKGLRLTDCKPKRAGAFDLVPVHTKTGQEPEYFKILLQNHPRPSKKDNDDDDDGDLNYNKDMGPDSGNNCLIIEELANGGGATGPLGGAQVVVGECDDASAVWKLNPETGEVSSLYFVDKPEPEEDDEEEEATVMVREEVCFTTGWPFLQAGAFLNPNSADPDKNKTIIVLNEASDAANFLVQDEHNVVLTTSIPPRSIQTFVLS